MMYHLIKYRVTPQTKHTINFFKFCMARTIIDWPYVELDLKHIKSLHG
jgi:hypothetical protein